MFLEYSSHKCTSGVAVLDHLGCNSDGYNDAFNTSEQRHVQPHARASRGWEIFGIFYREVCFGRSLPIAIIYGQMVQRLRLCLTAGGTGSIHGWGSNLACSVPQSRKFGLPRWLRGKEFACNAGDLGSVPGLRRSPGEGNCNPLPYSCQGNPMDSGSWRAAVHGVAKSWTWLSY